MIRILGHHKLSRSHRHIPGTKETEGKQYWWAAERENLQQTCLHYSDIKMKDCKPVEMLSREAEKTCRIKAALSCIVWLNCTTFWNWFTAIAASFMKHYLYCEMWNCSSNSYRVFFKQYTAMHRSLHLSTEIGQITRSDPTCIAAHTHTQHH